MLLKERIIGGVTGGVPESAFTTMGNDIVPGASGKTHLHRILSKDHFYFADTFVPDFKFNARVENGLLCFEVRNRGWQNDPNQKHPDIYPKLFLQKSYEHFIAQGKMINGIFGAWNGKGTLADNFDEYYRIRNAAEDPTSDAARIFAATHTPTGLMAAHLGFTVVDVKDIEESPDAREVTVIFRKPQYVTTIEFLNQS